MNADSLFPNKNIPLKMVVFDLDETLGYFVEFGMFWNALESFYRRKLSQREFNDILDLYPEFVRPNIIDILQFLNHKKRENHCSHVMIYTNNQGPKEWAISIKSYFESKMKTTIFDRIIAAFKVNGKQVEICRTTHNKTHQDFIKCTKLPENSQICFLDDVYHPEMKNDNVYYINVKPYVYDLPYEELIRRYTNKYPVPDTHLFQNHIISHMKKYHHTVLKKDLGEHDVDVIITKQILHHLQVFFNPVQTRRRKGLKTTRTAKKR
jgi:hypothetical protein